MGGNNSSQSSTNSSGVNIRLTPSLKYPSSSDEHNKNKQYTVVEYESNRKKIKSDKYAVMSDESLRATFKQKMAEVGNIEDMADFLTRLDLEFLSKEDIAFFSAGRYAHEELEALHSVFVKDADLLFMLLA